VGMRQGAHRNRDAGAFYELSKSGEVRGYNTTKGKMREMKRAIAVTLLAAALMSAAPIVYTEPVHVTGQGSAFTTTFPGPSMAWMLEFSGTNGVIDVSVSATGSEGFFGREVTLGSDFPNTLGVITPAGGGPTFSGTAFYNFGILPGGAPGGILTIYDECVGPGCLGGTALASVPIVGAFQVFFAGHGPHNDPNVNAWNIAIAPVPEPSAWLTAMGGIGLIVLMRSLNVSKRLKRAR
jgi:hypothetical protein